MTNDSSEQIESILSCTRMQLDEIEMPDEARKAVDFIVDNVEWLGKELVKFKAETERLRKIEDAAKKWADGKQGDEWTEYQLMAAIYPPPNNQTKGHTS